MRVATTLGDRTTALRIAERPEPGPAQAITF